MKKFTNFINDGNLIFITIRIIVTFLLFWAIGAHKYNYYNMLRILVSFVSIYGIYKAIKISNIKWVWIFSLICIFFNPIAKVELEKDYWITIDIITGLFFIFSIFFFDMKKKLYKNKKRIISFILISLILFTFSQIIKKQTKTKYFESKYIEGEGILSEEIFGEEIEGTLIETDGEEIEGTLIETDGEEIEGREIEW